jgi:FkbM family methyltransferase
MKNKVKFLLQKSLGLKNYLYAFALYKIKTLKSDKNENDFFLFLSLLKKGQGAVLDIGANLGIMSVHLAKKLPESTIHLFEPMPDNLAVLKRIVHKYKLTNTVIHDIALGDSSGTATMILPLQGQTVMQGLSHVKHDTIEDWNKGKEFQVKIECLDNVLQDEIIQAIKIDIENFEYFALKGAENSITQNKPIIYAELWDNNNRIQCFDFLKSFGYKTYVSSKGKLASYDSTIHQTQNFIFIAD